MNRIEAIQALLGAVKGYTVYSLDLTSEQADNIIVVNLNALRLLGVTRGELNEAILTSPFLSVSPEDQEKLRSTSKGRGSNHG